jgi:hypothetical protein
LAIITHITTGEDGQRVESIRIDHSSPASFIVANIPDGTPFRCLINGIDITNDIDAMIETDGEFTVIEYPGGGAVKQLLSPFSKLNDPLGINRKIYNKIIKQPQQPNTNQQAVSANNSLTDRTNKPRPYDRVYDVCGTVQSIPSDLMQGYSRYDENHKEYQYGYYYIARGFVDTPASGITDGDTLLSAISGSAANVYDPFTSPNNSAPRLIIGQQITEPLFITSRSNAVDGITLKAPNQYTVALKGDGVIITCDLVGTAGSLVDPSGDMSFDDMFTAGDVVVFENVRANDGTTDNGSVLDGAYTVLASTSNSLTVDATPQLAQWQKMPAGTSTMKADDNARVKPQNSAEIGFSDWVSIRTIKPERLLLNITAPRGMYRTPSDSASINSTSASVEAQWQLLDDDGNPIGPITPVSKTLADKSQVEVGATIGIFLPTPSAVRVRARRSSDQDTGYSGTVIDELKYRDLYAQIRDTTWHYGDMTTIHTQRKATIQATSIKEPQLKVVATEMLFKYLGGGVFDTVRTANTQAAQSLIRMMRDPLIGNQNLSTACMDKLIAVQSEIESYFGTAQAGQFCYTLDDSKSTAQDICQTIADAVFCTVYRDNQDITLFFERPAAGPAMVFTHRSKIGDEKWMRTLHPEGFDAVEYTWTDPKTNIREMITIPEGGGANPNKIDSKGVRNYQQAYWLAHRAYQKDQLQRISVEFTTTEEGVYAVVGQAISVVKGARVATYDGYVVAQNGLTLTLSQEVEFTAGDDHYLQLKRRDGSAESVRVEPGSNSRTVLMLSTPAEAIYTGNSAVKTEFSFGNEARHLAQMIIPTQVDPQADRTVRITGVNYHPDVFLYDGVSTGGGAFSDGFSNGFDI